MLFPPLGEERAPQSQKCGQTSMLYVFKETLSVYLYCIKMLLLVLWLLGMGDVIVL